MFSQFLVTLHSLPGTDSKGIIWTNPWFSGAKLLLFVSGRWESHTGSPILFKKLPETDRYIAPENWIGRAPKGNEKVFQLPTIHFQVLLLEEILHQLIGSWNPIIYDGFYTSIPGGWEWDFSHQQYVSFRECNYSHRLLWLQPTLVVTCDWKNFTGHLLVSLQDGFWKMPSRSCFGTRECSQRKQELNFLKVERRQGRCRKMYHAIMH